MEKVHELGVFVLFSTMGGDAWLLEVSQSDALQVAAAKEILTVDFEENPETIEINWTHTFEIKKDRIIGAITIMFSMILFLPQFSAMIAFHFLLN